MEALREQTALLQATGWSRARLLRLEQQLYALERQLHWLTTVCDALQVNLAGALRRAEDAEAERDRGGGELHAELQAVLMRAEDAEAERDEERRGREVERSRRVAAERRLRSWWWSGGEQKEMGDDEHKQASWSQRLLGYCTRIAGHSWAESL